MPDSMEQKKAKAKEQLQQMLRTLDALDAKLEAMKAEYNTSVDKTLPEEK